MRRLQSTAIHLKRDKSVLIKYQPERLKERIFDEHDDDDDDIPWIILQLPQKLNLLTPRSKFFPGSKR